MTLNTEKENYSLLLPQLELLLDKNKSSCLLVRRLHVKSGEWISYPN